MRIGVVRPAIVNPVARPLIDPPVLHLEFLVPVPPDCEQFFGDQGAVRLNSVSYKSPIHSSSVAGREIFVSHNSGRVTANPEVIPKRV